MDKAAGLVTLLLCTLALPCAAQEADWSDYAALLAAHVKPGTRHGIALNRVDYGALGADPRFAAALAALSRFQTIKLANKNEKLAFYLNAYNLLALKTVVLHRPLHSIKDVGNFFSPVWKREVGTLDGRAVSLDDIENGRLRGQGEPRIHMAIVCASVSCPDLREEPYRAATLAAQLDDQARTFLANPGKGLRIDGDTAHVSKIFKWFSADFDATGGVAAFIAKHHGLPIGTKINADLDYDWRLNGE